MDIILFSMSSWFEWKHGICNRNKHILDNLIKDNNVNKILCVDFLPFNFKSFVRLYIKSNMYKKNLTSMFRGRTYRVDRINTKLYVMSTLFPFFIKIIAKKILKDPIILNYNPLNIKYFKYFRSNKTYFDAVDNWSENAIFSSIKPQLVNNYRYIIKNSDYIFSVSENLKNWLISLDNGISNKIKVITNGVDANHYSYPRETNNVNHIFLNLYKELQCQKCIVGYLGVIKEDRIDADLLEFIVKNNVDKLFLIAGPIQGNFDTKRYENYNNIKFVGEVSYEDMPYLYSKFDVCIIPHLVNEFIKSMDPKKVYEYLACGKPVVSTDILSNELKEKFSNQNAVYIAKDKEEFNVLLGNVFKNEINNDEYLQKMQFRKDLIKEYSWDSKEKEMMNIFMKI